MQADAEMEKKFYSNSHSYASSCHYLLQYYIYRERLTHTHMMILHSLEEEEENEDIHSNEC